MAKVPCEQYYRFTCIAITCDCEITVCISNWYHTYVDKYMYKNSFLASEQEQESLRID